MQMNKYKHIHLYSTSDSDSESKDEFDEDYHKYLSYRDKDLRKQLITINATKDTIQQLDFGKYGEILLKNLLGLLQLDIKIETFNDLLENINLLEYQAWQHNNREIFDEIKELKMEVCFFERQNCYHIDHLELDEAKCIAINEKLTCLAEKIGVKQTISQEDTKISIIIRILKLERMLNKMMSHELYDINLRKEVYCLFEDLKGLLNIEEQYWDVCKPKNKSDELEMDLKRINQLILSSKCVVPKEDFPRIEQDLSAIYTYLKEHGISGELHMMVKSIEDYVKTINPLFGAQDLYILLEDMNKNLTWGLYNVDKSDLQAINRDMEIIYDTIMETPHPEKRHELIERFFQLYTNIYKQLGCDDIFDPVPAQSTAIMNINKEMVLCLETILKDIKDCAINNENYVKISKAINMVYEALHHDSRVVQLCGQIKQNLTTYKESTHNQVNIETSENVIIEMFKRESMKIQTDMHLKSRERKHNVNYHNWLSLDTNSKEFIQEKLNQINLIQPHDIDIFKDDFNTFVAKLRKHKFTARKPFYRQIVNIIYTNGRFNFIEKLLSIYRPKYFNYFFISEYDKKALNIWLEELLPLTGVMVNCWEPYKTFVSQMDNLECSLSMVPKEHRHECMELFAKVEKMLTSIKKLKVHVKSRKYCASCLQRYPHFVELKKDVQLLGTIKNLNKLLNVDLSIENYGKFVEKMHDIENLLTNRRAKNLFNSIESLLGRPNDLEKCICVLGEEKTSIVCRGRNIVYPNFDYLFPAQKQSIESLLEPMNGYIGFNISINGGYELFLQDFITLKIFVENMADKAMQLTFLDRIERIEQVLNKKNYTYYQSSKKMQEIYPFYPYLSDKSLSEACSIMKKEDIWDYEVDIENDYPTFVQKMYFIKQQIDKVSASDERALFLIDFTILEEILGSPTSTCMLQMESIYPKYNLLTDEKKEFVNGYLNMLNNEFNSNIDVTKDNIWDFAKKWQTLIRAVYARDNYDQKQMFLKRIDGIETVLSGRKVDLPNEMVNIKSENKDKCDSHQRIKNIATTKKENTHPKISCDINYPKHNFLTHGQRTFINNHLIKLNNHFNQNIDATTDNMDTFAKKMIQLKEAVLKMDNLKLRDGFSRRIARIEHILTQSNESNEQPVKKVNPQMYPKYNLLTHGQRTSINNDLRKLSNHFNQNIDATTDNMNTFTKKMIQLKESVLKMDNLKQRDCFLKRITSVEHLLIQSNQSNEKPLKNDNLEYELTAGEKIHNNKLLKDINEDTGSIVTRYIDVKLNENDIHQVSGSEKQAVSKVQIIGKIIKESTAADTVTKTTAGALKESTHSMTSCDIKYPKYNLLTHGQRKSINNDLKKLNNHFAQNIDATTDNLDTFTKNMIQVKKAVLKMDNLKLRDGFLKRIEKVEYLLIHSNTSNWINDQPVKNAKLQMYPKYTLLTHGQRTYINNHLRKLNKHFNQNIDATTDNMATFTKKVIQLKEAILKMNNLELRDGFLRRIATVEHLLMESNETNKQPENMLKDSTVIKPAFSDNVYVKYDKLTVGQRMNINGMLRKLNEVTGNNIDVEKDDRLMFINKFKAMKRDVHQMPKSDGKTIYLKRIDTIENRLKDQPVSISNSAKINTPIESISKIPKVTKPTASDYVYPKYDKLTGAQRRSINYVIKKLIEVTGINIDAKKDDRLTFIQKFRAIKKHVRQMAKSDDKTIFLKNIFTIESRLKDYATAAISNSAQTNRPIEGSSKVQRVTKPIDSNNIYLKYDNLTAGQRMNINQMLKKLNEVTGKNIDVNKDNRLIFINKFGAMKRDVHQMPKCEDKTIYLKRIDTIESRLKDDPIVAITNSAQTQVFQTKTENNNGAQGSTSSNIYVSIPSSSRDGSTNIVIQSTSCDCLSLDVETAQDALTFCSDQSESVVVDTTQAEAPQKHKKKKSECILS